GCASLYWMYAAFSAWLSVRNVPATFVPFVMVSVDAAVVAVSSAYWSENTAYQHPPELVASQAAPPALPARTTFRCWLYCVEIAFEFGSISVSSRVPVASASHGITA